MEDFKKWQEEYKQITHKVAMDNSSRVKRALDMLDTDNITQSCLANLEMNDRFKNLSPSVKSQIRKAVRLYIEFSKL